MLTSNSHGIKAAILRSYKEGGRRVAEPNGNDGYLFHYSSGLLLNTDPTRALTKLHAYLIEGDLRQLWQQAKQRLKDARSVYKQPAAAPGGGASSTAAVSPARVTAAELEHLYGSNGAFRVSEQQ